MSFSRTFGVILTALVLFGALGCERDSNVVVVNDEPVVSVPSAAPSVETQAQVPAESEAEAEPEKVAPKFDAKGVTVDLTECGVFQGVESDEEFEQRWEDVRVVRGTGVITPGALRTFARLPRLTEFLWTDAFIINGGSDMRPELAKIGSRPSLKKVRLTNLTDEGPSVAVAVGYVIDFFSNAPSLEELDLSGAKLSKESIRPLVRKGAYRNLKRLNLYGVKTVDPREGQNWNGDALAREILPLADRLVWLNLDDDALTSASVDSLVQFVNLEFLHVGRSSLTDDDVARFVELSKLKKVHITRSKATEEGAVRLRALLPRCEVVSQPE